MLVKSGSRQNSPFDSELVQFGTSSSQSLENSGSRNSFSTSDSQCTNNYSQPCLFDSTPVHFDLDTAPLASEEKSDMLDLNGRSSLASVDSQSAGSDAKTGLFKSAYTCISDINEPIILALVHMTVH